MNRKSLVYLIGVVAVLGIIFFAVDSANDFPGEFAGGRLLGGIDAASINKIVLEKSGESIELAQNNGLWFLPSRAEYPADSGKVRSLLLKLLDANSAQSIPSTEASLEKLGLNDSGPEGEYGRVQLFDDKGAVLGGLFIGRARDNLQERPSGPGAPLAGQYVRPVGSDKVFLIGLPISISTELQNWLQTSLTNVLSSSVIRVLQTAEGETEEPVEVFTLEPAVRDFSEQDSSVPMLVGDIPEGFEEEETLRAQVTSGLENLSITDVYKKDDPQVKDLDFNQSTLFLIKNGLQYRVDSASKDINEAVYIKLSVHFDMAHAEALKKKHEEHIAKNQSEPSAGNESEETSDSAESITASDPELEAKDKPAELTLSSEEEAEKLNASFEPWIYKVASHNGTKFRKTRSDLLRKKEVKNTETDSELETEAPVEDHSQHAH